MKIEDFNPRQGEPVLLVEPDGPGRERLRVVVLRHPVNAILERLRLADDKVHVRTWVCKNDERALTGQRIFREDLPPPREEPEKPVFDELVVENLPLTHGES